MQLLHSTPDCAALLLRRSTPALARLLQRTLGAAAVPAAALLVGNTTGTFALDLSSHGGRTAAAYLLESNRLMRKRLSLCWCVAATPACQACSDVCRCWKPQYSSGRVPREPAGCVSAG